MSCGDAIGREKAVMLYRSRLLLLVLLVSFLAPAQTHPVNMKIDASKTGAPISKYLYG